MTFSEGEISRESNVKKKTEHGANNKVRIYSFEVQKGRIGSCFGLMTVSKAHDENISGPPHH